MTALPPPLPPPPTLITTKYISVTVNGVDQLTKFIAELRTALENSKVNSGGYSAFLKLADGRVLEVMVCLPVYKDRT